MKVVGVTARDDCMAGVVPSCCSCADICCSSEDIYQFTFPYSLTLARGKEQ